jgi:type II secretory pathway pseudopilin PulG
LLEVLIATSAMLIAALGFSQALVTAMRAEELTRQQTLATQAARELLEQIRNVNFRDAFRQYNSFLDDDLGGPGTAPGSGFAVFGLSALPGDADGFVGEVVMPVDALAPGVLREDLALPALGCPMDVDASGGAPDANDHSLDYQLLPILIRVRWRGPAGAAQIELTTILGEAL